LHRGERKTAILKEASADFKGASLKGLIAWRVIKRMTIGLAAIGNIN